MATDSTPTILCCMCGVQIKSNDVNMCVNCLKSQVDITEGISKQVTLFWCRGCGRYQKPPWVACELESRELLAVCLKRIKGIGKDVKLVDAGFKWTEPHSRRIHVKLTVQKEVFNAVILQQTFVVELVVTNQQCTDCEKSYTEHVWNACLQVRQKVAHKRTFFFLEQLLIKHKAADRALYVKEMPDGLDFFFGRLTDAAHLLDFIKSVLPARSKNSKKLISQDDHNNTYNYKFTVYCEIVPICKDDLVVLEPKLCQTLGGVSPVLLCTRVSNSLHMVDPVTLKTVDIASGTFWRHPFKSIMNAKQLIPYVLLDLTRGSAGNICNRQNELNDKLTSAEAQVVKASVFGNDDAETAEAITHLGHVLKEGDTVLGYDCSELNLSGAAQQTMRKKRLPEVVLVRKTYNTKKNRSKNRNFKLKELKRKVKEDEKKVKRSEQDKNEREFETFMQEIEEDPELAGRFNLYKTDPRPANAKLPKNPKGGEEEDSEEDPLPEITNLMEDVGLEESEAELVEGEPGKDDQEAIKFGKEGEGEWDE